MTTTSFDLVALREGLDAAGADAWLLFDFRGINPVAKRVLGVTGMGSRRLFVLLPKEGEPVAVVHKIELQPFRQFPGRVIPYARWEELHEALRTVVAGRTVAMEISANDAVPYLDRVPYGVVELIKELGGAVVSSAALVTHFAARWSDQEREGHLRAAEQLATIARAALADAVTLAGTGLTECALQARVIEQIHRAGLHFDHPPIVAFGPNAADPHYAPVPGSDGVLRPDQTVLLDLWGGPRIDSVYADQTWMGYTGRSPSERVQTIWRTVRDARDAAIAKARETVASGRPLRGFEIDRAARDLIEAAGFGEYFVHRTGHSIDRDLHGSGPHCDDYETRDDRELMQGVGFSIEPGIYIRGEIGVRSEINMFWGPDGMVVTPAVPQVDLILPR
ncbi:MAG: M24 family metallopeptidase [Gemmatimonadota bacterium]